MVKDAFSHSPTIELSNFLGSMVLLYPTLGFDSAPAFIFYHTLPILSSFHHPFAIFPFFYQISNSAICCIAAALCSWQKCMYVLRHTSGLWPNMLAIISTCSFFENSKLAQVWRSMWQPQGGKSSPVDRSRYASRLSIWRGVAGFLRAVQST